MANRRLREGEELTQTAHETFNSRLVRRPHSALVWFALLCSKAKQCTVSCGYDHMPVSRGHV